MYIRRETKSTIDAMLTQDKVVLITGVRQVGKTTVLKEHLGGSFSYVSMENPRDYLPVRQNAVLFSDSHELLLIIDEVQRVPELLFLVKWIVDQSDQKGCIVLTGSQTYHLMKGVSKSLAGGIRIIEMPPLSLRELIGSASSPYPYVPVRITEPKHVKGLDIWSVIHRGSMPELQDGPMEWDSFYLDYVSAHPERDIRDLISVQDEAEFYSFMVARAARSGQLLDATDIENAIDVGHKTVRAQLSVLQTSNIVKVIQSLWPNVDKRLSKTPKIFFMGTGPVCYLTRWTTPEQLRNGTVAGHVFETFVVSEVFKSYMDAGANLRDVWFYRDAKKREINLVIQDGHVLHPMEVKTAATVGGDAVKNLGRLDRLSDYEAGFGYVVCQTDGPYLVTCDVQAAPVWELQLALRQVQAKDAATAHSV